jgi:hypothetical protein
MAPASLMTALTTSRAEGQMVGFREALILGVAIWLSAYASIASAPVTATMVTATTRSAQQSSRRNSCATQVSFPKHTVFSVLSGTVKRVGQGRR